MSKLVLIDGHAIMYRAFHAIPPLTTPKGEPINAVHGLISMLLKIIQDLKPSHIAVVFDEKAPTFRKELLTTYQSQRPSMPSELDSQFDKTRKFLKAANIAVYSKAGFEADDVIGTIAKSDTVIVTGDRDMLQLVDDQKNIKLFMPIGGLVNGKLFGEAETVERMGIPPSVIPDYKGLVGDASDNYFGVPGIGPKTAISLLKKYGDFKNIYKNLNEIPEKLKEKLEKGRESAEMSYRLATIIRDVPVEFDLKDMENWKVNSPDVIKLFEEEFGFKTLTARIKKVGEELEKEKQATLF
ncbi:MAG TPA: 5'-3' exonuclease H3TH domain-containing protein [Alphaproteobacteria bacterium]|jgi:DNA polymerase-1|nr:5'-3' exonuclease H3TH domain-containing protein [Alphaproteobacteria bacterium]